MIKKTQIDEILRLLNEGKISQRKIALRIGVSRTAVKAVFLKTVHKSSVCEEKRKRDMIIHPSGKPIRCPHCGSLVKMPCLACQLKEIKDRRRAIKS